MTAIEQLMTAIVAFINRLIDDRLGTAVLGLNQEQIDAIVDTSSLAERVASGCGVTEDDVTSAIDEALEAYDPADAYSFERLVSRVDDLEAGDYADLERRLDELESEPDVCVMSEEVASLRESHDALLKDVAYLTDRLNNVVDALRALSALT
jgi:hypothetical protein